VKDILEVLEQNNFSNQKQVEVLQILNFALFKKQYPQDLCGLIDRKIPLLEQAEHAANAACPQSLQNPALVGHIHAAEIASIKVRSVVILELLKKLQLGTVHNDLTKICKLIAFLTGNSYDRIYNELQKGVFFSNYHKKEIDEANKILTELNALISIDKDKQY
jgi:hypothetical protein